jgi:hypothetical protein
VNQRALKHGDKDNNDKEGRSHGAPSWVHAKFMTELGRRSETGFEALMARVTDRTKLALAVGALQEAACEDYVAILERVF